MICVIDEALLFVGRKVRRRERKGGGKPEKKNVRLRRFFSSKSNRQRGDNSLPRFMPVFQFSLPDQYYYAYRIHTEGRASFRRLPIQA
jgi:hypothetical protein